MGFDYNPYRHIEVIRDENLPNIWYGYCSNCGNEQLGPFTSEDTIDTVNRVWRRHIIESHKRAEQSFAGWTPI